jgi:zinc/manganese transport system substrate-binding protein
VTAALRAAFRAAAAAVAAALVGAAALAGCGSGLQPSGGSRDVSVVAAENFWGDVAAQVGGDHVRVTSIISDPNTDPHTYETDPQAAAELSVAQLVIENGLGYDDFIGKVVDTGGHSARRVLTVATVLGIHGADVNPHIWYDIARLPKVVAAIATSLSALDRTDSRIFHANAERFDRSLRPILRVIDEIRARYAGEPIAYTERVAGYVTQAAGLRLATPASFSQALEDGNDPSPQDTVAFYRALTDHRVKALVYNSQVVDEQTERIKQVARAAGVPIVGFSETMPPGATFQSWQLDQDRALLRALGG